MSFFDKSFDEIDEADIQYLFDNQVLESNTLDYKEHLPSFDNRDEKKKLINDVLAFANTNGGFIVFGIADSFDKPIGVDFSEDSDKFLLKISNCIRDSSEPRFTKMESRFIDVADSKKVLVLKIHPSWNAPHRNTLDNTFYGRSVNSNFLMDIQELRRQFLSHGKTQEKIEHFRDDRLNKIILKDTYHDLKNAPLFVFHLFLSDGFNNDYAVLSKKEDLFLFLLEGGGNSRQQVNLDGRNIFDVSAHGSCGYTQVFRNGSVEGVASIPFRKENNEIKIFSIQDKLLKDFNRILEMQRHLKSSGEIFIAIALLNVKNFRGQSALFRGEYPFKKEFVRFPIMRLEKNDYQNTIAEYFELINNAVGIET